MLHLVECLLQPAVL